METYPIDFHAQGANVDAIIVNGGPQQLAVGATEFWIWDAVEEVKKIQMETQALQHLAEGQTGAPLLILRLRLR